MKNEAVFCLINAGERKLTVPGKNGRLIPVKPFPSSASLFFK
jgi:hypothetical protein